MFQDSADPCSSHLQMFHMTLTGSELVQTRRFPRLLSADMEPLYVEELQSSVSLLMANLESQPISRGGPDFKQRLKRSPLNSSILDIGEEAEVLSRSDVVLSFSLEVSQELLAGSPGFPSLEPTSGLISRL